MLIQLSIRDIVLIERLDIGFEKGLSILTGETGAGKSILLDALSLALGGRGDASLVRHGVQMGQVTAVFDVDIQHKARLILRENGIDDEGDIIIRRIQSSDGRSRVFINDQAVSVSLLRDIGHKLVEIHGQHADRALIDVNAHRSLLDSFAGLEKDLETLRLYHRQWKQCENSLKKQRARVEEAMREADYLHNSVEELQKLAPEVGEEEQLALRRTDMMKSEKIATDIHEADALLNGQDSPISILANLVRRLERKIPEAETLIAPIVKSLDDSLHHLSLSQDQILKAINAVDFDPQELEQVEERLFALRGIARKYNVYADKLPELCDDMAAKLAELDAGEALLQNLEKDLQKAEKEYFSTAHNLSNARLKAADELSRAVMAELPALKLESAEFIVEISSDEKEATAEGLDRVEFFVKTNPGTKAGPMMKVASGGELSRFLLALKVVLADKGSAPTLIFDEIDTGVGGAVADAIGQRLAKLAQNIQVISVTHAPQVAAKANTHFLIAKKAIADSDKLTTAIHKMAKDERAEEIARMLAGEHITVEARAAAEQLLKV